MHMPSKKPTAFSRTRYEPPLKSLSPHNGLYGLENPLGSADGWLLQARNQAVFMERYMNLHSKIAEVIEKRGTVWELGNSILYCTD